MWQRLRSLARLPAAERRLALRAIALLVVVRVALKLAAFATVRSLVDRWAARPDRPGDPSHARAERPRDPSYSRAVQRAVDRAARTVPGSACLAQAIAAECMLRRAGLEARVTIGVAPDGQPLDAHAWVESAGLCVTGDRDDLGRYRTLLVFDGGRPVALR